MGLQALTKKWSKDRPMKKITKTIALLGAGLIMTVGIVQAEEHLGKIKERQEAMKAVGGGIKVVVETAKGLRDFDAAAINAAALTMKTNLKKASSLFPDGTDEDASVKNRARPEIWLDEEGFAAAMKKAIAAADNMAGVTAMADLMPALNQLGGSCQSCHEKFRAPEK